jgi:hypothetical protein
VTLSQLIFPPERRRLPHGRWWNIAARTVHLAATGVLLGGHVFGEPAHELLPFLYVAMASGAALILIELYPTGHWMHQGCAVAMYAKLGILCLIPFFWQVRVPLLLGALAIAAVGAHAPRTVRHYSFRFRKVMVD